MRIVIINQQGHNYGDEAAGSALVMTLLKQEVVEAIDVLYASDSVLPIEDSRVKHHLDISLKNVGLKRLLMFLIGIGKQRIRNDALLKWISIVEESDVIFVSPCGASMGIYKDWRYLIRLIVVLKCKKTPIFHFNTIGRSGNVFFDVISKGVLKKSIVNVREKKSLKYLNEIGIQAGYGPDTAYLLERKKQGCGGYIAFVPAHLDDWHPYFKKNKIDRYVEAVLLKEIACFVLENSFSIHVLPHFNTQSEVEYCKHICSLLMNYGVKKGNVVLADNIKCYEEYDNEIAGALLTIGMRYHAIVLSGKNAVPFVSVAYENKMIEVCEYENMGGYVYDLSKKNEEGKLYELLTNCVMNLDDNRKELSKCYDLLHKQAGKLIRVYINNGKVNDDN